MIGTKIVSWEQVKILPREKLMRKMEKKLEQASILFLSAEAGAGKLGALLEYIRHNHINNYLVWNCDSHDVASESIEILENQIKKDNYQMIIFQEFENLKDQDVLLRLAYLLENLSYEVNVICLSKRGVPDAFDEMFYRGRVSIIGADDLMFDYMEIRDFFRTRRIQLTPNETTKLYQMTYGWPGIVALFRLHWNKNLLESPQSDVYIQKFVKERLIKNLSKKELQLIQFGKLVPFFNVDFCKEVFGMEVSQEELVIILQSGVLTYDYHHKGYMVLDLIRRGIQSLNQKQVHMIQECAASWYEMHGFYREMFSMIKDETLLKRKLNEYAKILIRKLSVEELEFYMNCCMVEKPSIYWIYLKGWIASRREQRDELNRYLRFLREEDSFEGRELYLNLYYADGYVGIQEWMDEVNHMWMSDNQLLLYTMSAGNPLMSNGIKNFTELFSGTIKDERIYLKWWKSKMKKENYIGLLLARYDYFIETLREDKVVEEIDELFDLVVSTRDGELILSLIYILWKLQSEDDTIHYDEELDRLYEKLENCEEIRVGENAKTMKLLVDEGHDRELGTWMMYEAPKESLSVIQENSYLMTLKAKGYLRMGQCKKASSLAGKLAAFFERNQLTQFQAESLFIESVALYEIGEKKQAVAIATRAIAAGTKNRYIDIYTAYGETGWKLLKEYHGVIDYHVPEKKQYYYGNVLRANFDGYQSILLRRVKKGRKHKYIAGEHDDAKLSNLTMTELTILRYIARGLSNREISEEMNIKVTTVKTHIYTIYRKLGVSTRVQGINVAKEKNLI